MEKEREDKILEAIGCQREDIITHMDKQLKVVCDQNNTIISKLEAHDDRFDRIETAVLENSEGIKENSKDIKEIKKSLDIAITNHEQKIRKIEEEVGI